MNAIRLINRYFVSLVLLSVSTLHALDSQGNLAVAGFVNTDLNNLRDTLFSVVQYNPSGQINTTFGDGGLTTLGFRHGVAMDVAVNPDDDTIAVVGTAIDPAIGLPRAIIAKFLSDGTPDMSFNAGGALDGGPGFGWIVDAPSVANGIDFLKIGNNAFYTICGSLIQNGRYYGFSKTILSDASFISDERFSEPDIKLNALSVVALVGKYIAGGTPRPLIAFPDTANPSALVFKLANISGELLDVASLSADLQNFVVFAVGTHANKGLLTKFTVVSGSPPVITVDTSFGSNGYVIAEFGNKQTIFNAIKLVEDADGVIFVCGTARSLQSHMFVAAYDPAGKLIPTFGDNGVMTIFEGPNIQTIARDLALPKLPGDLFVSICPSGSSTGMFAVGAANGHTPLIANLNCSNGSLKTTYGDKAIASLETEALTSMTVLKETEPTGTPLPNPASSPFARTFNALAGNPFAVSLTGSGNDAGFVLQPGRYYLDAQAPIQDVSAHQLALYNDLLDINESFGDSIWNSSGILTKALLKGQLFVSEPTKYILRHYFAGSGPNFAVGRAANLSGLAEVYAQMNIQQL